MLEKEIIKNKEFPSFLNKLAKDLTSYYYSKLNRTFKVSNKLKGKGYDPVTTSDKAFEKFIRSKIVRLIKKLVKNKHYNFLETLAEDVFDELFKDKRIDKISLQIDRKSVV